MARDRAAFGDARSRGVEALLGRATAVAGATVGERGRGRREGRAPGATTAPHADRDRPGVARVSRVDSVAGRGGERREPARYCLTGVPRAVAGAAELLRRARGPGAITD